MEDGEAAPVRTVPQSRSAVETSGGEEFAVRTECDRKHWTSVAEQDGDAPAAGNLPDLRLSIRAGDQQAVLGIQRRSVERAEFSPHLHTSAATGDVDHPGGAVGSRGDGELAVVAESGGDDPCGV